MIDDELDDLFGSLPAISLEGARGTGKTATGEQRAWTTYRLDDPATYQAAQAQLDLMVDGRRPILIDEWQRLPAVWDLVRRAVDDEQGSSGSFLLTGSATPPVSPTHTGAGRIVTVRVRPMTLGERGVEEPTVSVTALLRGGVPPVAGTTAVKLADYVDEILAGGFPGMRYADVAARNAALDGYLDRIVDTDLPDLGVTVRRPSTLRRWLTAYAAAAATTASYDKIRDAATPGEGGKPAKTTTIAYRNALERLWVLEPMDAWEPTGSHLNRLANSPKHFLADPALAARLVGIDGDSLIFGHGPGGPVRDGTFLGSLFESLTALSLRCFAQPAGARVLHFRTRGGLREIDFVLERGDRRLVGVEVKLAQTVDDDDVKHLRWLKAQLGDRLLDAVVITTGAHAFRRADGIAVVPLALLGP